MKIIHFDTIDSTSKYLIDNHEKLDDMTFVYADYQSAGKGRENRKWLSTKGENLLCSILIKKPEIVGNFSLISLCSAVCILNILKHLKIKNMKIKWPNDVYINDKKVCGILLQGQLPNYLVVGIGLNVNQKEFNGDYRITPTSILNESGKNVEIPYLRDLLIKEILDMPKDINKYVKNAIKNDYLKHKKIIRNNKEYLCLGIQKNGSLKVKLNKQIQYLTSGEVTI